MSKHSFLQDAIKLHQQGNLQAAHRIYTDILNQQPHDANVLHLLGVLESQNNRQQQAINYLQQAVALKPNNIEFMYNLAVVYVAANLPGKAVKLYQQILTIEPTHINSLNNLGLLLVSNCDAVKARVCFEKVLQLDPYNINALNNLGNQYKYQQQYSKAVDCYQRAIRASPNNPLAYCNLGLLQCKRFRYAHAIKCLQKSLALSPDNIDIICNLAAVYNYNQEFTEALALLEQALGRCPGNLTIINCIAITLNNLRKTQQAIALITKLIAAHPHYITAYNTYNMLLMSQLQDEAALEICNQAIAIEPDNAESHWSKALTHLRLGQFQQGWQEHEWRWQRENFSSPQRDFIQPQWHGESLENKRLLIHTEQGIGDSLQFIRYLNLINQSKAKIYVECEPALHDLFNNFVEIEQLIAKYQPLPEFDYHLPLCSAPLVFDTRLETIPADIPYLKVNKQLEAKWHESLAMYTKPKLGFVWAGNPIHANDYNRSMPLKLFQQFFSMGNYQFVCLQKCLREEDLTPLCDYTNVLDLSHCLDNFQTTAAIILNLDAVIAVDTATAHLAAALGKSVLLLLPYSPDWRWLLARDDSPWYPTMKLFRQIEAGNWQTVINQVKSYLKDSNIQ